jgi:AcrR family transcriptional regulator
MATSSGVRSAKTERTRASLVHAARTIFARDGFLDAKISDITKAAKLAHGTFYTHFASKAEIFREVILAVHAEAFDVRNQQDRAPVRLSPRARVEAANRQFLEAYRTNAQLLASMEQVASMNEDFAQMRKATRSAYIGRSVRAIDRWMAEGLVRSDLDVECTAHALGSMVERYAYMAFVFGEGCTDEERALAALNQVWFGALGLAAETTTNGRRKKR